CDVAHRNDDRDSFGARLHERLADALGREHRSSWAVDPDDERFDALAEPLVDLFGDRVAARGTRRGTSIDDRSSDRDDPDGTARISVDLVGDVGGEPDAAVAAGSITLAAELRQPRLEVRAFADLV